MKSLARLIVPAAIAAAAFAACKGSGPSSGGGAKAPSATKAPAKAAAKKPGAETGAAKAAKPAAVPTPKVTPAKKPVVVFKTNLGSFEVELDPEHAPITTRNFLRYVRDGFYNGTIFHRVVKGFVIQGGGFTADLKRKPTRPPIKNESNNGLSNRRGTIAMARTADPDSATCQFYINLKDNLALDPRPGRAGYAVFGKVISGMDVVDKIGAVATGSATLPSGHVMRDVPVKTVVIESVTLKK